MASTENSLCMEHIEGVGFRVWEGRDGDLRNFESETEWVQGQDDKCAGLGRARREKDASLCLEGHAVHSCAARGQGGLRGQTHRDMKHMRAEKIQC